ncbi:MAG: site-specific integrase [Candidatus Tectomicrobia bacterium]
MATILTRTGPHGTRYQVRIRVRATQTSATFATLADARDWAAITEGTLRAQQRGLVPPAGQYTLGALIDRYIRDVLPTKPGATAVNYTTHLTWWQGQLGPVRLSDLTPARLAACRDRLAHTRAPATVNRYLATLGHALSVAGQEWGWLEASPMRRIRRLREPQGRVRFLSDEERGCLLEACAASSQPLLLPVVVLALSTGARKMEILRLAWHDVAFSQRRITLHATKNRERRAVPLTGRAFSEMQQLAKVRYLHTALCFPRRDGRAPIDLRHAWAQALATAHIADFRFHDLRHSAASYLAMNGASLVEIAEVLGHKTLQMVRRYAHLSEAHTTNVVAAMNTAIFGEHTA